MEVFSRMQKNIYKANDKVWVVTTAGTLPGVVTTDHGYYFVKTSVGTVIVNHDKLYDRDTPDDVDDPPVEIQDPVVFSIGLLEEEARDLLKYLKWLQANPFDGPTRSNGTSITVGFQGNNRCFREERASIQISENHRTDGYADLEIRCFVVGCCHTKITATLSARRVAVNNKVPSSASVAELVSVLEQVFEDPQAKNYILEITKRANGPLQLIGRVWASEHRYTKTKIYEPRA